MAIAALTVPAAADPAYDADLVCLEDERCGAEFIGAPEPPPLGLSSLLTAPNDSPRSTRLRARRTPTLTVASPRIAPHMPSAYAFGPRLKTEVARTSVDLNLGFDRGGDPSRAAPPSDLRYQWQLRAPLWSDLDVGLQGSGDMGPWSQVRPPGEAANRYGVSLYGLSRPDGAGLAWQAGYLSGSAFGRDGFLFTGSVKYGF